MKESKVTVIYQDAPQETGCAMMVFEIIASIAIVACLFFFFMG